MNRNERDLNTGWIIQDERGHSLKTVLLIDGDVLAHIACKNKWEWLQKRRKVPLSERTFKPPPEGFQTTKEEEAKYFQECYSHFLWHLNSIQENLFSDDYLMAMKGDTNYRDDLYPEYKGNRKNKANPNITVSSIRELAVIEDLAIHAEGREVDDYLKMWANTCKALGINYIVCSNDKDLDTIDGKHWNVKKNEFSTVTVEQAMRFYYEQLLMGDPVDNIPGLPRIGPETAPKLLAHCNTEEEFQEVVVELYMEKFGDEWESYLLSNGKMLHIQNHWNDYFTLEPWDLVTAFRGTQGKTAKSSISIESQITKVIEKPAEQVQTSASSASVTPRFKVPNSPVSKP